MKILRLIFLAVYLSLSLTGFSQTGIGIFTSTSTSGTDTYTATVSPTFAAYLNDQRFQVTFTNTNTGPASININGKGVKNIVTKEGTALTGGELTGRILLTYNGTSMQILGGGGTTPLTATQINTALGYTPATSTDISTFVDGAIDDLVESGETDMTSTEIVGLLVNDPDALQLLAPALEPYFTAPIAIPELLGVPVIGGTLSYPNTLTATPATFTGQNVTTTWQWERDGTPIGGATSITYALQVADQTNDITVVQTATNSAGADVAESVASTIAGAADSSPPTITAATISNITSTSFTVNIESDELATHFYVVITNGSANPTAAQIIAGVNYGAVTVIAAGNADGTITNQSTQQVTNLTPEGSYEIHKVARDPALNISAIDSDVAVSTLATATEGNYVPLPDPTVFAGATTTITDAAGSTITVGELGGNRDILIAPTYENRFRPDQVVGTEASKYRFKSVSDAAYSWVGGANINQGEQIIQGLNGSNYLSFYHLGVIGDPSNLVDGISGFFFYPYASPGAFYELSDIRIKDVGFAGMQINWTTLNALYNFTAKFVAVSGYPREGEGLYLGSTGGQHARFINTILEHIFIYNKGRDGIQLNNHSNFSLKKFTTYLVGQSTLSFTQVPAEQRNHIQIQNSTGLVEDGICWGAVRGWNIFSHGVTIRNVKFYITGNNNTPQQRAYIGKAGTAYPGSPQLTGVPIVFENCHFGSDTPVDYFTTVAEDGVDIFFINCTKDANVANIFFDNRADKVTHTLSHTGTTTASSVAPTFESLDITDREAFGKATSTEEINRGLGWRMKTPTSTVVTTPTDQSDNISFSNVDHDSFDATWVESTDAAGTLILVKSGSAVSNSPSNDVNYVASSTLGSGSEISTGNWVVYKSTGNTVTVDGLTASTTYHVRAFSWNGSGSDVKFITSTATGNPASQATTAAPAFNPFTDITWDTELDNSTAQADLASGIWSNAGADGDATVVLSSPTWDAGKQAVNFVKSSNQRFTIQAAGSYVFPLENWLTFHTPTSWSGSAHTLVGFSSTHRIAISTAGVLMISGVSTGQTLALDTDYTLRTVFNGTPTAATWTLNNGTVNNITLSASNIGTPNWRLGSNFGNTEHYDGWIKYAFVSDAGLTSQNIIDMWDWSGNWIFILPLSGLGWRRRKEYKIAA